MATTMINKQDLMELGYPEHTARSIIRQAKVNMVQQGYPFYLNKRLGLVPVTAVESLLGTSLTSEDQK